MDCGLSAMNSWPTSAPSRYAQSLEHPHDRAMDFTGRPMNAYVFIDPAGCSTDRARFRNGTPNPSSTSASGLN